MSTFHRLLRVDLSSRTSRQEPVPESAEGAFVGGKGLGTAYLAREVSPDVDALSADNKLLFCPGVLVGTLAPAACRYELVTVSPLTGLYLDCNAGGHFATALKATGHDMVIVEGAADAPVVLQIRDGDVTFLDAHELWGRPVYETETTLRAQLADPSVRIASIGVAGENLVRLASVSNDYSRQAARGGPGAVMGSKRLKAIAVSGTHAVEVDRSLKFVRAVDQALQTIRDNAWVPGKRAHGTAGSMDAMAAVGAVPVRNFSRSDDYAMSRVSSAAFEDRIAMRFACAMCPVACSKGYRLSVRSLRGEGIEGPEYESISMLGPNCGVFDPEDIAAANLLCNELGLDTISAGATIGMVLQAADEGRLAAGQLGLPSEASASRADSVLWLLQAIAHRQGVGDLLAEGAARAAAQLRISDLAPHVKRMELPAYDPRVSEGMALAFMTADRGACHLRTWPLGRELSGDLPRFGSERKIEFVVKQQNDKAAEECLGVCQFPYGIGLLTQDLPSLLGAAVGKNWSLEELRTVGERIWNLSRLFNVRRGVSRSDDYLPDRFATHSLPSGPVAGRLVPRLLQDAMLDQYYSLRGWTPEGTPAPATLQKLGLDPLGSCRADDESS